jgi:predicted esterase
MSAETRLHPALVHGRVLVETPSQDPPAGLLVGFHGYGETADAHLEELRRIPGAERWVLCAVQGLARFYTRKGDVVASWMTSQDREQAIDDNVRYAASVVASLKREHPDARRLVFAGFSQGVAMAYRAAAGSGFAADALLALAGDVPPELAARRLPGFPPVLLGRGSGEEWYTEEKLASDLSVLEDQGVEVRVCRFEGGHEWTDDYRRAAGEVLAGLAASP